MKKRWISLVTAAVVVMSLVGCSSVKETALSAVNRDPSADDGIVWFDDDAVALAESFAGTDKKVKTSGYSQELNDMAKEILELVNQERAAKNLGALSWNNGLESCAAVRAKECKDSFSHTRPNGKDWYTVNSKLMWGENLAKGYESAEEVVEAWMNSPTHAENILGADFKTCSIAIYETGGKLYFAQEFGH